MVARKGQKSPRFRRVNWFLRLGRSTLLELEPAGRPCSGRTRHRARHRRLVACVTLSSRRHRKEAGRGQVESFIAVGMAAPSMKERQVCWGARDEYWKCLDENLEDASQCKKLRSSFESSCPQQWIKYFDKRRDYLKFKEKFEAGQFEPSKTTAKS
ncbi:cytochrome c oxidase assembly factor 6 homolog isoform X1 [Hylobates moloch]|uniref:cytochrome c oxidase assembly factor 6 homolog isoform X1 n=1 Tax=Hylobates moloch TaxID=81572 RepID=UPI001364882D|nr:cytochrome c oxidase assembly factor 6 homolog isoform X1 [Hylobates moloch]